MLHSATTTTTTEPQSEYPKYLIDQAAAHGLSPEQWIRMKNLKATLPQESEKPGGHFGKAAHLAAYTWEGVAFGMMFDNIAYLFKTLILPPHLKEMAIYDQLPDSAKYIQNSSGAYPKLFKPKLDPYTGVASLTDEVVPHRANMPHYILWANGFMPKPTKEMGYENRLNEHMANMLGASNEPDPYKAIIYRVNQGQQRTRAQTQESVAQLRYMQGLR